MSFFQRIFKNVQSQAHSVADKLEDPIKMSEQGIRDLKKDLQGSMRSLAQVKAIAIRFKKDSDDQKRLAKDNERKAMLLLQKMKSGDLPEADAERLATEVLTKKEEALQRSGSLKKDYAQQKSMGDQLQAKVGTLKETISRFETELVTLRARAKTATSMRKINQQMSSVDSSSTIALLERMKDKVIEEESLAEAYGEMTDASVTMEQEIDRTLAVPSSAETSDSLAELKKKMGI